MNDRIKTISWRIRIFLFLYPAGTSHPIFIYLDNILATWAVPIDILRCQFGINLVLLARWRASGNFYDQLLRGGLISRVNSNPPGLYSLIGVPEHCTEKWEELWSWALSVYDQMHVLRRQFRVRIERPVETFQPSRLYIYDCIYKWTIKNPDILETFSSNSLPSIPILLSKK